MEIISHNLGAKKLLRKQLNNQTAPQTEPQTKEAPQAPAFKGLNGLKQLGKYGAAALLLAGTMLGATSCEKTEVDHDEYWEITVKDKSEEYFKQLIALMEKLIAQNEAHSKQYLDAMDSLRELIATGNAQDQQYYNNIMSMMTTISAMMTNIEKNTELNNELTTVGLNLMTQILANLEKNNELVGDYGKQIVDYLKTIEKAILAGNDSIIAVLELMWTDINSGNTALFEAMTTLGSIMNTNNQELIDKITNIYEDDKISEDQRAKEIINAINEVKATVDGFQNIIKVSQGELKATLEEFMAMYNKNEIGSQKLMELMYNALIEGNTLDKLQLEQLHQIWVKMENGDLSIVDSLNEIKNILSSIDSTLKDMSAELNNIYNSIVNLNNDMKNGNIEVSEKLEQVITNQKEQTTYLDVLVYVNKQQKENLDKMNMSIEQAIALLAKIENNTGKVTLDELKAILKQNNAQVIATIEKALKELNINIDESTDDAVNTIIKAMNEFKALINSNQEDMDSIVKLLASIDLNTELSNAQMNELLALVKELKALANDDKATQTDINAKLDAIKAFLANIDSTLTEISDQLKDIFSAINNISGKLDNAQKDYVSYLQKLINNTASIAELTKSQQQVEANSATLIQKANEAIELLKNANSKLGDLNYKNLIVELKKLDSDLAAQLEAMIKNLGISINQNTNNAADQIIAALNSIKSLLNSNNADMKEVIAQLSSLNLKADLNATQMAELIKLVEALKLTVEDSGSTQDEINAKLDDIKAFLASIDNTLKAVLDKLNEGVDLFNDFYADYKANEAKFFNSLGNISTNIEAIKANGANLRADLAKLQGTADDILAVLEEIRANQGDDITIDQLKDLSAENLAAIKAMLENLGVSAEAKLGDIINAIKSSSIDLTTTNNLLQTIINMISRLNGSSDSNAQIDTILSELLNAYKAGNADLKALLESANSQLEAIYAKVCDIYEEVASLSNNFKTYASLYETNMKSAFTKLDAMMGDIKNAESQLGSLNSAVTVGNTYLKNLDAKATEIIEILENQAGGSGITKAELEAILKDAGADLQEMLDNLGISINNNTTNAAADIINAIKANSTDMTTTNNLLQTIINNTSTLVTSVRALQNQGTSVNTSALEAKIDALIQAMNNGNANLQSEMEAVNKAIQDLIKEVQAQNSNTGS